MVFESTTEPPRECENVDLERGSDSFIGEFQSFSINAREKYYKIRDFGKVVKRGRFNSHSCYATKTLPKPIETLTFTNPMLCYAMLCYVHANDPNTIKHGGPGKTLISTQEFTLKLQLQESQPQPHQQIQGPKTL